MNFFKGLATVGYLYFIGWLIYNVGFMNGHKDAMNDRGYRFDVAQRAFK
jgi:uncharacterized membrane protein YiaA